MNIENDVPSTAWIICVGQMCWAISLAFLSFFFCPSVFILIIFLTLHDAQRLIKLAIFFLNTSLLTHKLITLKVNVTLILDRLNFKKTNFLYDILTSYLLANNIFNSFNKLKDTTINWSMTWLR